MKFLTTLAAVVVLCVGVLAAEPKKSPAEMTEAEFKADGPRLYSMADALEASKVTGKPVVCWMGKSLFANAEARKLSAELGDTTIQAAMDTDGTAMDALGFRVKFSSNNYDPKAPVYNIRLANFSKPGTAEEILRVSRGAAPTFKVK